MWDKVKKLVSEDRSRVIIGIVLVMMIVGMIGISYAFFLVSVEQKSAFTIVVGELQYTLKCDKLNENREVTVPAGKMEILNFEITNEMDFATVYEFYYEGTNDSNVEIMYYKSSSYDGKGTLKGKETVTVNVVIQNNSTLDKTIKFGIQGGFVGNTLTIDQGNSLREYDLGNILLSYSYEGEGIVPSSFPSKDGDYQVKAVKCDLGTGVWDNDTWSLDVSNSPSIITRCHIVFEDKLFKINKPELIEGLIPVIYNENSKNWVKADTTSNWYDYESQMWANAVTVTATNRASYMSATPGTTIPMNDINTMWVWIPRYEYMYTNLGDQYAGGTRIQPGEIKVNFISKTATSPSDSANYKVHPAFTFGDEELSGFWYGKFETSSSNPATGTNYGGGNTTSLDPKIIPNVTSWRMINVSNMFTVSRKLTASNNIYGLSTNADSHMSKNSEWGAVAYLSQSKYGKYGNSNYSGANKEVYNNNYYGDGGSHGTTLTGCSSGTPSASYSTTCAYTYEKSNTGTGASITGTIYGVYDMSGGSWEYVMGNLNNTVGGSGFSSMPESKYYDLYASSNPSSSDGTSSQTACNGGVCYGHALSEVKNWYSDHAYMIYTNAPWFVRGGVYGNATYAGVFHFYSNNGSTISYYSSRLVLLPSA